MTVQDWLNLLYGVKVFFWSISTTYKLITVLDLMGGLATVCLAYIGLWLGFRILWRRATRTKPRLRVIPTVSRKHWWG